MGWVGCWSDGMVFAIVGVGGWEGQNVFYLVARLCVAQRLLRRVCWESLLGEFVGRVWRLRAFVHMDSLERWGPCLGSSLRRFWGWQTSLLPRVSICEKAVCAAPQEIDIFALW